MERFPMRCQSALSLIYHLVFVAEFHCPQPPQVNHARPNVSETRQQHGTAIRYQCDDGYDLDGTQQTVVCEKTTWVGTLPSCVAVEYPITQPPAVTMGERAASLDKNGTHKSSLMVSCLSSHLTFITQLNMMSARVPMMVNIYGLTGQYPQILVC